MIRYGAGADPCGGGADEFAWGIVHREGDRVIVDLIAARGKKGRQPFDLDGAVRDCCADLKQYGLRECVGDRYAGGWVIEAFARQGLVYRHSERNKSDLYLDVLPLITAGRLEVPNDPELIRQMKLLERRRGSQGKDMVDHPQGGHDDRVNALALAVAALGPARRPFSADDIWVSGSRMSAGIVGRKPYDRPDWIAASSGTKAQDWADWVQQDEASGGALASRARRSLPDW